MSTEKGLFSLIRIFAVFQKGARDKNRKTKQNKTKQSNNNNTIKSNYNSKKKKKTLGLKIYNVKSWVLKVEFTGN